jgi:hypothetical protein
MHEINCMQAFPHKTTNYNFLKKERLKILTLWRLYFPLIRWYKQTQGGIRWNYRTEFNTKALSTRSRILLKTETFPSGYEKIRVHT